MSPWYLLNILEESSKVVKVFETKPNPEKADAKVTMANVKMMKLDQKSDTPMPTIISLHRRDSLKTQGKSRILIDLDCQKGIGSL